MERKLPSESSRVEEAQGSIELVLMATSEAATDSILDQGPEVPGERGNTKD
jgi:hypothetical protein